MATEYGRRQTGRLPVIIYIFAALLTNNLHSNVNRMLMECETLLTNVNELFLFVNFWFTYSLQISEFFGGFSGKTF